MDSSCGGCSGMVWPGPYILRRYKEDGGNHMMAKELCERPALKFPPKLPESPGFHFLPPQGPRGLQDNPLPDPLSKGKWNLNP